MLKDKTTLFIIIASLLGTLVIVLISYIYYHYTNNRKKLKHLQSTTYNGNKEILEYDTLTFTYDTNIETQQTNFPAELSYHNIQGNVHETGSLSSESNYDETEHVTVLKSIDLVQPFTTNSKSSSECSELVDVVLVDNTKNNGLRRSLNLPNSGLGRLSVSLFFDKTLDILRVNIIQWYNSGSKSLKAILSPYVKVQLFPDLKRKFFTKTKRGENPVFDEEFTFHVTELELKEKSLHLSVCDFDKFSRQNILGNGIIKLEEFLDKLTLLEGTGELWVNLTETNEASSEYKGEISFSLSYFPTTNRITLTVVKAKDLNVEDNDTRIAVKVRLLFGGKVTKRRKTSYHQSDMSNPIFNESWVFDIPNDTLEQTSFLLCVYAYSHKKKRIIGTAASGSHVRSKTGLAQWNEMLLQRRDRTLHWHKLL